MTPSIDAPRRRLLSTWLRSCWSRDSEWLKEFIDREAWVVVPVESGLHFDSGDAERLSRAARLAGCKQLFAVTLEEDLCAEESPEREGSLRGVYAVEPTPADLAEFSRVLGSFNYILVAEDFSFAVACITEEYYLIAGPPAVVEAGLEGSIGDAQGTFLAFARDSNADEWTRRVHMKVADRYCSAVEG